MFIGNVISVALTTYINDAIIHQNARLVAVSKIRRLKGRCECCGNRIDLFALRDRSGRPVASLITKEQLNGRGKSHSNQRKLNANACFTKRATGKLRAVCNRKYKVRLCLRSRSS